jgi:ribonucleoside-triphosphate reductase
MALIARYEKRPYEEVLREYLQKAEKILITHKRLLKDVVASGMLKFFNIEWEDMKMFFSTVGYTGLIDAFAVVSNTDIDTVCSDDKLLEKYVDFADKTINIMEDFTSEASQRNAEDSMAFNVEEIPAENASPKMATADNFLYKDKEDYVYTELLSNQMIPLYVDVPIMKRMEISGKLMNKVSGGSILHVNITEEVTEKAYHEIAKMMIEEFNIPHFGINVGSTTCCNGHTVPGIYKTACPVCGARPIDWTMRVVGFQTDVSAWSKQRRKEFMKRQIYTAKNVMEDIVPEIAEEAEA